MPKKPSGRKSRKKENVSLREYLKQTSLAISDSFLKKHGFKTKEELLDSLPLDAVHEVLTRPLFAEQFLQKYYSKFLRKRREKALLERALVMFVKPGEQLTFLPVARNFSKREMERISMYAKFLGQLPERLDANVYMPLSAIKNINSFFSSKFLLSKYSKELKEKKKFVLPKKHQEQIFNYLKFCYNLVRPFGKPSKSKLIESSRFEVFLKQNKDFYMLQHIGRVMHSLSSFFSGRTKTKPTNRDILLALSYATELHKLYMSPLFWEFFGNTAKLLQ